MASDDKWCFTKEQLDSTPSRQCGIDAFRELVFRQQAGNFIQDMGQRLKVTQLCINTAIVYMHRFFVFHSFTQFPWNSIAAAALFLAAKVEEQPRKLEHVIRVHQVCRNIRENIDINSERYQQQCQDLVFNENILLQTLGFDVAIDHPHTHVVRCCHLVGASKDLAQTSYFMASNSLHLTTMCLQYKPTIVACFCIHLACKWSNWEIPLSNEDREWFTYVDPLVTGDLLKQLTEEFLKIFDKCPQKLKEKIMANGGDGQQIPGGNGTSVNSPFDSEPRRIAPTDESRKYSEYHIGSATKPVGDDGSGTSKPPHPRGARPPPPTAHDIAGNLIPPTPQPINAIAAANSSAATQQRDREYREKKERERLATTAQQYNHSAPPAYNSSSTVSGATSSGTPVATRRPPAAASGSHHGITPEEYRHRHVDKTKMAPPPSGASATSSYPRPQNSANPQPQPPQRREAYRDSNKREHNHLLKPNAMLDSANSGVYNSAALEHKQLAQPQQPKLPQPPAPIIHTQAQVSSQHQHQKQPYLKQQTHDIKRLLNSAEYDQHKLNSGYLKQGKVKQEQPCPAAGHSSTPDSLSSKSVPISNNKQSMPSANIKQEFPGNGYQGSVNSNNGSYNTTPAPLHLDSVKVEQQQQMPVKKPSMFSPEKTPPRSSCSSLKQPTPVKVTPIKAEQEQSTRRTRTMSNLSSSSSEPELRPVIKKIDQVEGFENILRDNTIRTHGLMPQDGKAPDMASMTKPEIPLINNAVSHQALVNGIETNPTLISNLLKETSLPPMSSHLSTISSAVTAIPATNAIITAVSVSEEAPKEHHHHKERKKKSKEKHKHKDKDKDKSRHTDDGVSREKKKKHKDKDKDRHRKDKCGVSHVVPVAATAATPVATTAQPIKITIPRDKIQSTETLKIKISKDRINTESIADTSGNTLTTSASIAMSSSSTTVSNATSTGLKIKIAKIPQQSTESSIHVSSMGHTSAAAAHLQSHSSSANAVLSNSTGGGGHRKRDREPSNRSNEAPLNKISRANVASANQMPPAQSGSGKQNGRNSSNYHKVSYMQNANQPMVGGSLSSFPPSTYHQHQQQMNFPPPMQHIQGMRHPQLPMGYTMPGNQYMTDYSGYYGYGSGGVGGDGRYPPQMYHHDPATMLQAAQLMGYPPPPGHVPQGYGQVIQSMTAYGGGTMYSSAQPLSVVVAPESAMPPPLPTDAPPELPPPPPPPE